VIDGRGRRSMPKARKLETARKQRQSRQQQEA
jgi:hypothetical protein